ncbi:unnamed protein product [Adineta steineri]|uniref:Uncharacterized protein n=1 Tax=Adineta steineri TaxID=433720 RepID=A0A815CV02_9BILA|nr:unnamed protein product [Adineta steineri]CAF1285046.1 unnamed protein product [Adineta steineri]
MTIKDLDLNQVHHPLLNACHSLTSTLNDGVIWHSTQLHFIQLIVRFPPFKQNEERIYGILSRILQIIQKSLPHFHPFVYVHTDPAQFNVDSNLNIIASPFIGLVRSLITEYE